MLELINISKSFYFKRHFYLKYEEKKIFENINLKLSLGENLLLEGVNGSGKSTLAKIIANLLKPSFGKVIFQNKDVLSLSKEDQRLLRKKYQYIFQNQKLALNPYRKVKNILFDVYTNFAQEPNIDELYELFDSFFLKRELLELKPFYLSGGEASRIGLIRALISKPVLFILDENLSNLDKKTKNICLNFLKKMQERRECSYIFIAHDDKEIKNFCKNNFCL